MENHISNMYIFIIIIIAIIVIMIAVIKYQHKCRNEAMIILRKIELLLTHVICCEEKWHTIRKAS